MNRTLLKRNSFPVLSALALFVTQAQSADTLTPDLTAVGLGRGWKGATSLTKLVEKDGAPAIEFSQSGANLVWLENELTDRTGGSIGLWCNGYGLIGSLKIAPAK